MSNNTEDIPSQAAPRRKSLMWVAALALAIIPGIISHLYLRSAPRAPIDSVAVLPFENMSGDPENEYLSDGIAESLINSLSRLPNLKLMARDSAFRYKGNEADARTVGRELGVRAIIKGRVTRRGDNLTVSVAVIDASDNSQIWGQQYNRRMPELPVLQEEIATGVIDMLRAR